MALHNSKLYLYQFSSLNLDLLIWRNVEKAACGENTNIIRQENVCLLILFSLVYGNKNYLTLQLFYNYFTHNRARSCSAVKFSPQKSSTVNNAAQGSDNDTLELHLDAHCALCVVQNSMDSNLKWGRGLFVFTLHNPLVFVVLILGILSKDVLLLIKCIQPYLELRSLRLVTIVIYNLTIKKKKKKR